MLTITLQLIELLAMAVSNFLGEISNYIAIDEYRDDRRFGRVSNKKCWQVPVSFMTPRTRLSGCLTQWILRAPAK